MAYNSLRDRHGVHVGNAPIAFAKTGPDEYRSKDGAWVVKHKYRSGYQAHHEWTVTDRHEQIFHRGTSGHSYMTLSDAVQAINEAVAMGVVGFLINVRAWRRSVDEKQAKRDVAATLRRERETVVWNVLMEHNVDRATMIAVRIVDQLFGKEA